MKFIHCADIHLDSVYSGLKSFYGSKALSIAQSSQRAFIRLIDLANAENVDFIVIAGDLFDSNWKDYQQGLFMVEQIKRFSKPIFYIRGNHDAENRLLKKIPYPSNFIEFSSLSPQTHTLEHLKVALHGQSYPSQSVTNDLSRQYPEALPGFYNIGILHSSGEVSSGEKPYSPFVLSKLKEKNYDYWALGHVHDYQILSEKPYVVYSGILQGRHIKEVGPKGCCLVEVDHGLKTKISFKETSDIHFLKVEIDVSALENEEDLKKELLKQLRAYSQTRLAAHRFVLRVSLKGQCHLKPSLYEDLNHYQYTIHCWLEEQNPGCFFIERVENLTTTYTSTWEDSKEFPLMAQLKEKIKTELLSSEIKEEYLLLVKKLKSLAPLEYKKHPYWAELEEGEIFDRLAHKTQLSLLESLRRDS